MKWIGWPPVFLFPFTEYIYDILDFSSIKLIPCTIQSTVDWWNKMKVYFDIIFNLLNRQLPKR